MIYVKAGIYKEAVNLTSKYVNITMYGDGPKKTVVTGSKNFIDGTKTSHTATFGRSIEFKVKDDSKLQFFDSVAWLG